MHAKRGAESWDGNRRETLPADETDRGLHRSEAELLCLRNTEGPARAATHGVTSRSMGLGGRGSKEVTPEHRCHQPLVLTWKTLPRTVKRRV